MLNSENKYHITISFNQKIEGILLSLIDGAMETVYMGVATELSLELSEGIYKLKASFIDYTQEYLFIIDKDENFQLDFDYPSVAPILSFKTTHEYFHGPSENYSQAATNPTTNEHPNFLFFAAKYDKDKFPEIVMENLLSTYSIINNENKILYQFSPENAAFDTSFGWMVFSDKLINGLYFLQWKIESDNRIFPFYIFDNYQTQFFIRYSETADFENCFFFYTRKMGFRQNAPEYLILDKIMFAFKDYNNYKSLNEEDKSIILEHPYLMTLIYILQTELSVASEYANEEHLPLPDLSITLGKESGEQIPVISSVMTKYICNLRKIQMPFKPGSLIDRIIDNLKYDLFWNNFSKIDNVEDWNTIYTSILSTSKAYTINSNDNPLVKLSKSVANLFGNASKETISERLDSLMGNLQTENLESKVISTINSIGDVSQIANKLDLPPTKVLRNYETYKGIYDKLK